MLESLHSGPISIPCSLEIEKPRDGIEVLFPYVGILLFSREYALAMGFTEPLSLLGDVRVLCPYADLFCTWGDAGAVATDRHGNVYENAASAPATVVDTLGAGDTFNAAVISGYLDGLDIRETLARACRLAGKKCGQYGLDGLGFARAP
jgi:ketohexokinase